MSFVVDAFKSVVKGVVNAVKSVIKAVGKVVSAVVNFVVQPFMGLLGAMGGIPSAASEAQRQEGVLITNVGGGTNFIPVVYGIRQVGGSVVYVETGADKNKYLWVAYALSEGPIEGIYDLAIDDENVTTTELISSLNSGNQFTINKAGRYKDRVRLQFFYGSYNTDPFNSPMRTINHLMKEAPSWKESSVMNGVAVLMARYEWKQATTQEEADNNPFSGNIPMIKATILGRKVASLLTDSGTENHNYQQGGYQERWSTNPAECLLDYLRNPRYGKGLRNSEIDWQSFRQSALKFNQSVTYVTGIEGPILTCSFVLDTSNTIMSNTKVLLQGMRSYMPYVQGKYKLKVEDAGNANDILSGVATVVADFTKDDIISDITYTTVDRSSKYTQVEVTYTSPADKWANQTVVYPINESDRLQYQVLDGGRENKGTFTFPTLINYAMAYDMARLLFEKSRYQQTCSFKTYLRGMELEPGDIIRIRGNILEFDEDIPWRIVSLQINTDFTVDISCVRNPDFIYPHVRANEKDIVLPPYVPRGAGIYYPGVYYDVGLQPPRSGFWEEGQAPGDGDTGIPTPPPTDPDDPRIGGGVGTPGGGGGSPPAPGEPPAPPATNIEDYITVDNIKYTVAGEFITAEITFNHPDNVMYDGVRYWWKRNITGDTAYESDVNNDKPGVGRPVTLTVRSLRKGPWSYVMYIRIKYSGNLGDSTKVTKIYLNASGAISTENPVDYIEGVSAGWTPGIVGTPPNTRLSRIETISAIPTYASAGVPTPARGITITLKQDIIAELNTLVSGVNIYHKPKTSTYWYKTQVSFVNYLAGIDHTFTPTLDLGARTYPSADDGSDQYDFIFRLAYNDGTESTKQRRYMDVDVENTTSANIFYGVLARDENSDSYSFLTIDEAPAGAVVDQRNMKVTVRFAAWTTKNSNPAIAFTIDPPVTADRVNWVGVRLYKKQVLVTATSTTTEDFTPVPQPVTGIFEFISNITYDDIYEYVIVPLVIWQGSTVESNYGIYVTGAIHNRTTESGYPSNGNWLAQMTLENLSASAAKAKIGTASPAGLKKTTFVSDLTGSTTLLTNNEPRFSRAIRIALFDSKATTGVNGNIKAINIYTKNIDETAFTKYTHTFSPAYVEGITNTISPTLVLGPRSFPYSAGRSDVFDFIFRFVLTDDSECEYQTRAMNCSVETDSFGGYLFNPFSAAGGGTVVYGEKNSDYPITTKGNLPPGTVDQGLDRIFTDQIYVGITNSGTLIGRVVFEFLQKDMASIKGVHVRYRNYDPNVRQGDFVVNTENVPVPYFERTAQWQAKVEKMYGGKKEIILTPILIVGNEYKASNRSHWFRGELKQELNWRTNMREEIISTSTIPDIEAGTYPPAPPPTPPVVPPPNPIFPIPTGMGDKVKIWKITRKGPSNGTAVVCYYEITLDVRHLTNMEYLRIYRRHNRNQLLRSQAPIGTGVKFPTKYYNLGRWEEIQIDPLTDILEESDGRWVINLRAPIMFNEFDSRYLVPNLNNNQTLYNASIPWSQGKKIIDGAVSLGSTELVFVPKFYDKADNEITGYTAFDGAYYPNFDQPSYVDRNPYTKYAVTAGYARALELGNDGSRVPPSNSDIVTSYDIYNPDPYDNSFQERGADIL